MAYWQEPSLWYQLPRKATSWLLSGQYSVHIPCLQWGYRYHVWCGPGHSKKPGVEQAHGNHQHWHQTWYTCMQQHVLGTTPMVSWLPLEWTKFWSIKHRIWTHLLLALHICVGELDQHWVQIMTCCLDGAKPLSEPMLIHCQLDPKEHISMKFYLKFKYFHSRKCIWACRLRNGGHFVVPGELS